MTCRLTRKGVWINNFNKFIYHVESSNVVLFYVVFETCHFITNFQVYGLIEFVIKPFECTEFVQTTSETRQTKKSSGTSIIRFRRSDISNKKKAPVFWTFCNRKHVYCNRWFSGCIIRFEKRVRTDRARIRFRDEDYIYVSYAHAHGVGKWSYCRTCPKGITYHYRILFRADAKIRLYHII